MPNDMCNFGMYCSVGLHPWYTNKNFADEIEKIRNVATDKKVLMIGETGLDKLRGTNMQQQTHVFLQHIDISESVGKPLIIHCVKAFDDILAIKHKMQPKQPWIIHGFRGKPQQAQQLLDNGFRLSFGEHFNHESLTLAFNHHSLLLETDESTLSIEEIYTNVAHALHVKTEELEESINAHTWLRF